MWEWIVNIPTIVWILIAMFLFLLITAPLVYTILKEQFGDKK